MLVSLIGLHIFLLMDSSNILSCCLNSDLTHSSYKIEQTVGLYISCNMAKWYELWLGTMVNHIVCPKLFAITDIIPICSPLSTPEAGYQYQNASYNCNLTYSEMYIMLYYISFLDILPSIRSFLGRSIRDPIYVWYTNVLSHRCRSTSYCLIWHKIVSAIVGFTSWYYYGMVSEFLFVVSLSHLPRPEPSSTFCYYLFPRRFLNAYALEPQHLWSTGITMCEPLIYVPGDILRHHQNLLHTPVQPYLHTYI